MKLLHRVVKSSQVYNFQETISIDNTVVIKPRSFEEEIEDTSPEDILKNHIEIEVQNRLASISRELSEKETDAMSEINLHKSRIISEAITEAEKIRKDAETQALVARELAREKGNNEGFAEGKKTALSQLENSLKAVALLLSELTAKKEEFYIAHENQLIDLALEMTKKITRSEIKTDREIIFGIVKQACKTFRNSDYVKISVAKCDFSEGVVTDINLLRNLIGNIPNIELELLSEAESGTIIIDNEKEIIDAGVPTQLELLQEIMNSSKRISD